MLTPQLSADPGGRDWLALGEDALPAGQHWLAPGEVAALAGLRYTKRRTEFLLRRVVAKHAVVSVTGRPTDPAALPASRCAMRQAVPPSCASTAPRSGGCRSAIVPDGRCV
ncbi:hypothetical protein [Mycobacterium sp.]|uniref:hypothetical protein n=1 Tax=Mycobacterium sp. TaxID=1785 RepID=UPI003F9DC7CA